MATEKTTTPRLVLPVAHSITARYLLDGQARYLQAAGFQVSVTCNPGPEVAEFRAREGVAVVGVPMAREMAPIRDLSSMRRLAGVIREIDPHIVNASTPKAGLLGMLAARRTGVPHRIYTLRGLRLETARGFARQVLTLTEKIAARCAHRVVCVSESLRQRVVGLGLMPESKTVVLGRGSSNGVDVVRYRPSSFDKTRRLRSEIGIPDEAPVIGFVGRFTKDKGIEDLADVFFGSVVARYPEARLLLLGDFEDGDPVSADVRKRLESDPSVVMPGFVADTAPFHGVMDLLAFPSYREGFPNAPMEAAASGKPVAGYATTGTVDAVVHDETGLLVPIGDRGGMSDAIHAYLENPQLRESHGRAGRVRAETSFAREIVWENWVEFYRSVLAERGAEVGV